MEWTASGSSHVGRVREDNEDAYLVDDGLRLAVVADGMGGHASGEVASRIAVHVFRDAVASEREAIRDAATRSGAGSSQVVLRTLREAVEDASRAVLLEARRDAAKRGMGTTLSALLVAGDTAYLAHVGDSRVYLVRDGRVARLTRDHTVLAELIASGEITPEDADSREFAPYRNALSRAVGVQRDVVVDVGAIEALPGDIFVLCSDGLTKYVRAAEIAQFAGVAGAEADLVALANSRGGGDNTSVVVARLTADSARDSGRSDDFDRRLRAVRDLPPLRDLGYADVLQVLAVSITQAFEVGDVVSAESDAHDTLYAVLSGEVAIEGPAGGAPRTLSPGESTGIDEATASRPAGSRLVARRPSCVLRVARTDVEAILRRAPAAGRLLLAAVAAGRRE